MSEKVGKCQNVRICQKMLEFIRLSENVKICRNLSEFVGKSQLHWLYWLFFHVACGYELIIHGCMGAEDTFVCFIILWLERTIPNSVSYIFDEGHGGRGKPRNPANGSFCQDLLSLFYLFSFVYNTFSYILNLLFLLCLFVIPAKFFCQFQMCVLPLD